jgi:hypothetical protein
MIAVKTMYSLSRKKQKKKKILKVPMMKSKKKMTQMRKLQFNQERNTKSFLKNTPEK